MKAMQGKEEVIMAGFGGQGVLFLGKVVAEVGMAAGKNVSWLPSYGPEMRGGTANCSVVISEEPIASPIVNEPDMLIAMNRPSVTKFLPKVKKGGVMIYNSSLIPAETYRDDVTVIPVPASKIAGDLGSERVANVVMAGAFLRACPVMTLEQALKQIEHLTPAKKKDLLDLNKTAFTKGYEYTHQ
ncbi:MAG TPA: 2-oxoacid:acceptor oxidoreductase family protein [Candidatus Ozemobacteraceae bacterium]|nr:2-oxoacid:acceptor oxidoreductase family protein [Candidatus Ozemobacteraceae bacterium]HQG28436.1 2-oxoacid:acceptor oxidoreductase family protein [Candidatus Ozemobacteraceae bacterium]